MRDGLGLELGHPASVVFDEKRRAIRLKMNTRFVRSRDEGDEQVLTKPFTLTTAAGSLELVCFCVADEHHAPPTPAIMKAIEAVRSRDDATTRVVLGDVLEEAGALAEAEYVRLELDLQRSTPSSDGFIEGVRRLRTLSTLVGPTFRYLVGRDIDGCSGVRWAFRCPTTWDELAPTDVRSERVCQTCRQLVVQVHSEAEARTLAREGVCSSLLQFDDLRVGSIAAPTWVGSVAVRVPPSPPPVPSPSPEPTASPKKPWWKRLLGG